MYYARWEIWRCGSNQDLRQLLELYTQLHNNEMPSFDEELENIWSDIISDRSHVRCGIIKTRKTAKEGDI